MLKWSMELIAFNIEYKPHLAIKAHALADFIAEGFGLGGLPKDSLRPWILAVDESSNPGDGRARLIIRASRVSSGYMFYILSSGCPIMRQSMRLL